MHGDNRDELVDESALPATTIQDALILDRRKSKYALPVYIALCYHAKSTGRCFPAVDTLVSMTGLGETTVKETIRELIVLGYVTKEMRTRPDGGYASNLYTIAAQYEFIIQKQQREKDRQELDREGRPATPGGGSPRDPGEGRPATTNTLILLNKERESRRPGRSDSRPGSNQRRRTDSLSHF